jgi:glycosyltransferase involved in cell wall biosynthesis
MTMHIAISGWLLGEHSGANRRLLAILEHLPALLDEHERVTVLHRPDYAPPALPRIEWQPIAIPAGPAWRRARAEARELPAALVRLGANVLDHGFLPLPHTSVPTCLLLHDLRAAEGLSRWPRWLALATLARSCRRAAAIVVPSQFTAARLRTLIAPTVPVHVIANGVVMPPVRDESRREYLLHVGHIEPRKNLAVVVRALAQLPRAQRPPLHLVGRDTGSLKDLHALANQLGVPDSLHWCGVRDDAATAELYAAARAVVVPSRYEGFGLAALEGLAHGRPVLVADAGALPEVVGNQGIVIPAEDASAWARAITSTEVDTDGAGAERRRHAAKFSWQQTAATMLAVWRQESSR